MPKFRSKSRGKRPTQSRAPRSWSKRFGIAAAAVTLGYVSVASSLALAVEKASPERAYNLWSGNGRILARLAQYQFSLSPGGPDGQRALSLANKALLEDPTAVEALNVIGLQAQMGGDTQRARNVFRYSLLLSRRELRPQLWAIEDAVGRGDLKQALNDYDLALRTSTDAENLLFPNLAAAISEPRVRTELIHLLATGPAWRDAFLTYVAGNSPDPSAAHALFDEGAALGLALTADLRATLVNSLFDKDKYEEAWNYYARFHNNADRRRSRDPNFSVGDSAQTVFGWTTSNQPGISVGILKGKAGGRRGVLDYAVSSGKSGTLVRQVQMLPPGRYRIEGHGLNLNQPETSRPYWLLSCLDGRELGRVEMPSSAKDNNGHFQGQFVVPAGCKIQSLSLIARYTDAITGVSGQVDRVTLLPIAAAGAEK